MNAAQKLYAAIGGTAVKAALGSLRGWGIDLRNPHTRKAGPGRKGVHVQGLSLWGRAGPRIFADRRNGFIAGE